MGYFVSNLMYGFRYVYDILYKRLLVYILNIYVCVLILVLHIHHKGFDMRHSVSMFFL